MMNPIPKHDFTPAEPPGRFLKFLFKLPNYLYKMGLGWLLGKRFLYLEHIGRKSGLPRMNTVEVAGLQQDPLTFTIVSGYGKQSNWYKNLRKTPRVRIQVGWKRYDANAKFLNDDEGGLFMMDYARRHPRAAQGLMRMLGYDIKPSDATYRALGETVLKVVVLHVIEPEG